MEHTSHDHNSFWNKTCYKKVIFWLLIANTVLILGLVGCMMHMRKGGRDMMKGNMRMMKQDKREYMRNGTVPARGGMMVPENDTSAVSDDTTGTGN